MLKEDAVDAELVFAELMATAPPTQLDFPACALVYDANWFVGQALILTPLVVQQVIAKRQNQIRLARLKCVVFWAFQVSDYLLVKGVDLAVDCQIDSKVVGVPAY